MASDRDRGLEPLSAAVLAGGASRRMGRDKALLRLAPDLPPLAAVVIDRLRTVADDIVLVASPRPDYDQFDVPVVPDRFPNRGPLGGIATALAGATHPYCLVVACDMPFLNSALLRWMATRPRDYDLLLPCLRQHEDGRCHPLHAIYAASCLLAIERRLTRGQLDVLGLAAEVRTRFVRDEDVTDLDPSFASFVNVNTPADLALARSRLGAEEHRRGRG